MRSIRRDLALLVLLLASSTAQAEEAYDVSTPTVRRNVPVEHVVEEGDTLWDLCEDFWQEPWRWPNVWALNPHVTNPHWIYPGDILRLLPPDGQEVVAGEPLKLVTYTIDAATASQVSINEGFIAEKELKRSGTLKYSTIAKRYLFQGEPVYLEFENKDEVRIGQQFSVYTVIHDVIHPVTDELLGQKIQVLGIVEVDRVDDHVVTGHLARSFNEIERGALLTPLLNHYQVVSPKQNLLDLQGLLVSSFRDIREIGQFHVAFIDKGAKDGVQIGNRLFVLRRGDGYVELEEEFQAKLPWEQVGELLVVETQDRNSTVLVTRSTVELHVGDRVEMQRNY